MTVNNQSYPTCTELGRGKWGLFWRGNNQTQMSWGLYDEWTKSQIL